MRQYKTEAMILRRTNYGEADRILTLLTPQHGQVGAIAKGVRKPKSKLAGGLELFAVCDVTVAQGRGELGIITSARMRQFFGDILHEYDRMELGYAMIKETFAATRSVSEPEFYETLKHGLECLNDMQVSWRLVEMWFRLRLQSLLGRGINLATDIMGKKLKPDVAYHYDFGESALYESPGGRFTGEHIKLLRLASVKSPRVLAQIKGADVLLDDCLWMLRTIEA